MAATTSPAPVALPSLRDILPAHLLPRRLVATPPYPTSPSSSHSMSRPQLIVPVRPMPRGPVTPNIGLETRPLLVAATYTVTTASPPAPPRSRSPPEIAPYTESSRGGTRRRAGSGSERSPLPDAASRAPSPEDAEMDADDADSNLAGMRRRVRNDIDVDTPGTGKRHTCPTCNKRFNRPSSLAIHQNTHSGAMPFICPHPGCGRAFNVNSNMRRHLRNHNNNTIPGASAEALVPTRQRPHPYSPRTRSGSESGRAVVSPSPSVSPRMRDCPSPSSPALSSCSSASSPESVTVSPRLQLLVDVASAVRGAS
ncbi:C2H2 finger domain transcription factor mtfA [Mycena kentingensis (nom. inval.)]|nr:C2H2 finger domain transcription factor mtfA [Mycena kentingensis (nom. inval.)]